MVGSSGATVWGPDTVLPFSGIAPEVAPDIVNYKIMKTQEDGQTADSGGNLTGRTALVTGAGRGIGRAIACALAEAGAAVVLTSRTGTELAETAAIIGASGGVTAVVLADVTDRAQ